MTPTGRDASQLPLPLPSTAALSRSDFIVAPANAKALRYIEAWPDWPVSVLALYGPAGCGKSHLVSIWRERSGAQVAAASALAACELPETGPLAIEDVDSSEVTPARDSALFVALDRAGPVAPLLLTGKERPADWPCALPDLASRLRALTLLPVWSPDDEWLAALARKLFLDRQLVVPETVIAHMLRLLERSPAAVRDFVGRADREALSQGRPVNLSLVRALIAARERVAP